LYLHDCLEWLDEQPGASFEAIITDPPYGLKEYTAEEQVKLRAGRGRVWRIPQDISISFTAHGPLSP
jgi:site-specific DNA-methyltransferase (adenine-specific)